MRARQYRAKTNKLINNIVTINKISSYK